MDLVELSSFLVVFGEPEVSDFVGLILDEDVGRLEVTVDDRVLMQIFISADQLIDNNEGLGLWKFLSLLQNLLEGAFIAELLE